MKKLIIIAAIAIAFCGHASAQRVQRANVYFENNSAGLTTNIAGLLDTIYTKLPEGKTIRIGLVGNGEDFQLILLVLGVLSVVYCTVYTVLKRIRIRKAARLEAEALSESNLTNLPSH